MNERFTNLVEGSTVATEAADAAVVNLRTATAKKTVRSRLASYLGNHIYALGSTLAGAGAAAGYIELTNQVFGDHFNVGESTLYGSTVGLAAGLAASHAEIARGYINENKYFRGGAHLALSVVEIVGASALMGLAYASLSEGNSLSKKITAAAATSVVLGPLGTALVLGHAFGDKLNASTSTPAPATK